MNKKIFNDLGFLSKEGKVFVNDGFVKEVKKVLSTALSDSDVAIISSILKSIIGEESLELQNKFLKSKKSTIKNESLQDKDTRLIKPELFKKVKN